MNPETASFDGCYLVADLTTKDRTAFVPFEEGVCVWWDVLVFADVPPDVFGRLAGIVSGKHDDDWVERWADDNADLVETIRRRCAAAK